MRYLLSFSALVLTLGCGGTASDGGSGGSSTTGGAGGAGTNSGGTTNGSGGASGGSCEYKGTVYDDGASVPADDCNTCSCSNGSVVCTERACGTTCGGFAGTPCAENEFCNYGSEGQCGAGDATGTCEVTPDACDANYDPVCGCDGNTYANACMANAAGTNVSSSGACP